MAEIASHRDRMWFSLQCGTNRIRCQTLLQCEPALRAGSHWCDARTLQIHCRFPHRTDSHSSSHCLMQTAGECHTMIMTLPVQLAYRTANWQLGHESDRMGVHTHAIQFWSEQTKGPVRVWTECGAISAILSVWLKSHRTDIACDVNSSALWITCDVWHRTCVNRA